MELGRGGVGMPEKQVTRRGLLSLLGMGAAATAAAGMTIGVDTGIGKDKSMFRYVCDCGEGLMAEVPTAEGESVNLKCKCGVSYTLTWMGDHFRVKSDFDRGEPGAWSADELPDHEKAIGGFGPKKED